jgi:hypothetical protein
MELGLAIVNVARIVPDGLLVFFPSYTVLNGCIDAWRTLGAPSTIWRVTNVAYTHIHTHSSEDTLALLTLPHVTVARDRLTRLKHLVVEPREASAFAAARLDFEAKLDGAVVLVLPAPSRPSDACFAIATP